MTPATENEKMQNIEMRHVVKATRQTVMSGYYFQLNFCTKAMEAMTGLLTLKSFPGATYTCSFNRMRATALLLWCVLLLQIVGCGLTSLTNGSIPEGKSTVKGRVIAANNSLMAVANVPVTLYSTPAGETTSAYRVVTDSLGQFVFNSVPTGKHPKNHPLTIANVVVAVDTKLVPYQPQRVSFLLTESQPTSVVMALPPTGFDVAQVGSVSLNSSVNSAVGVVAGNKFSFTAELLDRNNSPITSAVTGQVFVPDLVLNNLDITDIGANGTFQATGSIIGVSSISASISLPGGTQPISTTPVSVPVANSQTVITNITPLINQGAPSPPFPP